MIKKQLDFLKNLSVKLKQSNSSNEKKIVLNHFFNENNLLFDKIFDYILSYDKKYWVTSENISKLWEKFPHKYNFNEHDDLFLVLDKITCREITGYDAINYIIDLINFCGDEYKEYIFNIIDKDLKANVNVSLVNKISSNSVKEFKVALAERSDEAPMVHKINFDNEFWMISRKLDGVRTLTICDGDDIKFYSRTGTIFTTLDNLKPAAKKILDSARNKYGEEFVLDGECCIINDDGSDNFSGIMKEITRKNHTIKNPKYIIFDLIKKREFDSSKGNTSFKERMHMLEELNINLYGNDISLIYHSNSIDKDTYEKWLIMAKEKKWEGLMLRDEKSFYTGKRSFDLQKVKSFFDAEYKVIGIEIGKKKMLHNGVMQETECVKSLIIEHKNTHMNVGSGISDEERILWLKNPELIVNSIITVQYFEETIDSKTGNYSLRFPTLKIVHGKKREV